MILHDQQSILDWHIIESEADLPTKNGEYMVFYVYCQDDYYCESTTFEKNGSFWKNWWMDYAIAWRELTDIERGIGLPNVKKQIIEPSEEEDEVEEASEEASEELGQMSLQF